MDNPQTEIAPQNLQTERKNMDDLAAQSEIAPQDLQAERKFMEMI